MREFKKHGRDDKTSLLCVIHIFLNEKGRKLRRNDQLFLNIAI